MEIITFKLYLNIPPQEHRQRFKDIALWTYITSTSVLLNQKSDTLMHVFEGHLVSRHVFLKVQFWDCRLEEKQCLSILHNDCSITRPPLPDHNTGNLFFIWQALFLTTCMEQRSASVNPPRAVRPQDSAR